MSSRDIVPADQARTRALDVFDRDRSFGDFDRRLDLMMNEMHRALARFDQLTSGTVLGARTEIVEENGNVIVRAELPGYEEDDLDVTVAEGLLTIRAERSSRSDAEREADTVGTYSVFQHSLLLPSGIDTDHVEATLKNGLLTVTLPPRAEATPVMKKIAIQRAEGKKGLSKRHTENLTTFREKLNALRAEAAKIGDEVSANLKARMDDLEELGEKFAIRLSELEKASEGTVSGMRQRLEATWHEMSQGLSRLTERVRQKKNDSS